MILYVLTATLTEKVRHLAFRVPDLKKSMLYRTIVDNQELCTGHICSYCNVTHPPILQLFRSLVFMIVAGKCPMKQYNNTTRNKWETWVDPDDCKCIPIIYKYNDTPRIYCSWGDANWKPQALFLVPVSFFTFEWIMVIIVMFLQFIFSSLQWHSFEIVSVPQRPYFTKGISLL